MCTNFAFRLQEETAKVEKFLLEGNFIEAIVACFNAPRASAFDYNLLEPLQKLLRLSSPIAASLARPDLYSGILQKLNHKKAVVRLNLLRIVKSIDDPSDDQAEGIRGHALFEAIQRLAENDNAVLVRNMASELVKASLENSPESLGGGRPRPGQARRTYTPPSLLHSTSMPMTPTHTRGMSQGMSQSSSFIEGSVTPRRAGGASSSNGDDSILYRPKSRDGPAQPQITRRTSAEIAGSSSMSKSRVPRPSMLRGSRSSLAATTITTSSEELATSRRENGVKIRDQIRSSGSQGSTAPQLTSKRRTRQPSGDIKWS
jgi:hypothetical protein